jgi:hypothetical protein
MRRKPRLTRPTSVAVLALIALALSLGGVAFGSASNKVVKACASKKTGALRLSKNGRCKRSEKAVSWNKQGAPGTNGTNGAVAGYSALQSGNLDITADTSYAQVLSKALPAGNFIVNAKAELSAINNSATGSVEARCELVDGVVTDQTEWASLVNVPSGLFHFALGSVPLTFAVSSSSPSTVDLQCETVLDNPGSGTSQTITVENAKLTAVQTSRNG